MEGVNTMNIYAKTGAAREIKKQIPGSVAGESVTIKLRRDSDGYWYNFATDAFQVAVPSPLDSMTFDMGEVWKESFTPNAEGIYSCWITYDGVQVAFIEIEATGTGLPVAGGAGLISEAELESFLETSLDTTLAATLINSATALLERVCGRTFRSATSTNEYLSGEGTPFLYLKNFPVTSITSLTLYDRYSAADVWTLTEDRDFYLDPETGRIVAACGTFQDGRRNYRCTYVGGYATIPDDLKV